MEVHVPFISVPRANTCFQRRLFARTILDMRCGGWLRRTVGGRPVFGRRLFGAAGGPVNDGGGGGASTIRTIYDTAASLLAANRLMCKRNYRTEAVNHICYPERGTRSEMKKIF